MQGLKGLQCPLKCASKHIMWKKILNLEVKSKFRRCGKNFKIFHCVDCKILVFDKNLSFGLVKPRVASLHKVTLV